MLIKCGYKSVTIDTSKAAVIETMDGERKEIIPANEEDNIDLVSLQLADSKKCGGGRFNGFAFSYNIYYYIINNIII
jgi:hypothetical protein